MGKKNAQNTISTNVDRPAGANGVSSAAAVGTARAAVLPPRSPEIAASEDLITEITNNVATGRGFLRRAPVKRVESSLSLSAAIRTTIAALRVRPVSVNDVLTTPAASAGEYLDVSSSNYIDEVMQVFFFRAPVLRILKQKFYKRIIK